MDKASRFEQQVQGETIHPKIAEYINRAQGGENIDEITKDLPEGMKKAILEGLGIIDRDSESEKKVTEVGSSAGAEKVQEYISRIRNGELKEKIMEGLPNSFIEDINAGLSKDDSEIQKQKIKQNDVQMLAEVRKQLGLPELEKHGNDGDKQHIRELIDAVIQDRKKEVIALYEKLFADIDNPESKKILLNALFGDVYNKYRVAEYPSNPDEEKTWEKYANTTNIPSRKENGWMYRGIFPEKGSETLTRGSFNVNVTPELIDGLDNLIASGRLQANYKFGEPGTSGSSTERHDSITIYFLNEPSEEILKELADIIQPHVRGNNLLGKKVTEGFYMSEIGSVSTQHINEAIAQYKDTYPELVEAIRIYTSPRPGSGTSLKMSEAQFYAVRDVAESFGYKFSYDPETGFSISK